MTDLILPEWAFLDAHTHQGDQLYLRTVILHIRSMTIIEIFNKEDVLLKEGTLKVPFRNTNTDEFLIAALRLSTTIESRSLLIDLLKECASWYCDYCDWEDKNINYD